MRKLPVSLGLRVFLVLFMLVCASPASAAAGACKNCTPKAFIPPKADITTAIGASTTQASLGNRVTFTLTASNPAGPQDAASAQLTATFPSQLQLVSSTCIAGTGGPPPNPVTWSIGTLTAKTSQSCSVVTTVVDDSVASVNIRATISSTTSDPDTTNNTANYTLHILPQNADVSTSIGTNATSLSVGQTINLTFKATNLGPAAAPSTRLIATLPSVLQLKSASCVNGSLNNPIVWNVGTLAAGSSMTCAVQASLNSTTLTGFTINDSITSSAPDNNPGNNSGLVTISVVQGPAQGADLAIHIGGADIGQAFTTGESLLFTVTASNTGSSVDASGVVATLHLPNDGRVSGISASCGTADASGKLVWTIGNLAHGASKACTVTASVAATTGAIPVSANITAAALGADLSQLMDAVVFPVDSSPRQISRTVSGAATTKPSTHVALNRDGTVAVFQSQESDLVTVNVNTSGQDIYRVGADGKPVLETLDANGHQLIGSASLPKISSDGALLAFAFAAGAAKSKDAVLTSMWGGGQGQPKQQMDNGMGGTAPNGSVSGGPSVASAGGSKKLVFCSSASNLVPNDTNGARDVFLVDPANPAQTIQRVSTDSSGQQLPGDSCEPNLSADGKTLVFTVSAPDLYHTSNRQVVRKDLVTGDLEVISLVTTPGGPGANADSSEPTTNADGSVIAFTSAASNLDTLGAPVGGKEAFVSLASSAADGAARILKRVRSGDGTVPNGSSQHPQLSDDGTIVVMQTSATNFFGSAKQMDSATPACGAVAITTNFFSPASMGSSLCNGQTSNQNPAISGDGTTTGFDSNAAQSGTGSSNSNAYTQGVGAGASGVANLSGDLSGQWYDPNQSGQGLVIDVSNPDANNNRIMVVTWFVYVNGQPTWIQGVATPQAGSGPQAGEVVVQMQMGIFKGTSFPRGNASVTTRVWGNVTITFADANTGVMTWTSSEPGFNSGTMPITHFLPVSLPAQDPAGAKITACYSGNWYNHAQSGAGFELEVLAIPSPLLVVDWFAYGPDGSPVWLQGVGPISGNTAQVQLQLINGIGAQFPPKYDAAQITQNMWGTASFTFTDSAHASVTWNSTITGYGTGSQPLQPLAQGLLDRRSCQ